jgi:hypothetical protein
VVAGRVAVAQSAEPGILQRHRHCIGVLMKTNSGKAAL